MIVLNYSDLINEGEVLIGIVKTIEWKSASGGKNDDDKERKK